MSLGHAIIWFLHLTPVPPPMHTQTHSTLTLWFCCKPATMDVAKRISETFTKINILLPFRFKDDTWKNSELRPWMMMFSILTFYVFDQKCHSVTLGQILGWHGNCNHLQNYFVCFNLILYLFDVWNLKSQISLRFCVSNEDNNSYVKDGLCKCMINTGT